jgi:hypothetical protein
MSLSVDALRGSGSGRGQVDHRLLRRSVISEYRRGRLSQDQVCDAHPELIRAANNVGTETAAPCPICEHERLRLVTYVFGSRLPKLDRRRDELWAYVVEACIGCHWHHLRRVFPVGGR